jgi:hypothetical protein
MEKYCHTGLLPSRQFRTKGAALLSGGENQTERTITAYAQCARLFSLQIGSINLTRLVRRMRGAPVSGTEEHIARAISAYAQYACLLLL